MKAQVSSGFIHLLANHSMLTVYIQQFKQQDCLFFFCFKFHSSWWGEEPKLCPITSWTPSGSRLFFIWASKIHRADSRFLMDCCHQGFFSGEQCGTEFQNHFMEMRRSYFSNEFLFHFPLESSGTYFSRNKALVVIQSTIGGTDYTSVLGFLWTRLHSLKHAVGGRGLITGISNLNKIGERKQYGSSRQFYLYGQAHKDSRT